MDKITLIGVRLYNYDNSLSERVYDFKNNCEFKIKKGDEVVVKIGTGGTTEGIVEYIEEKTKESGIKYKNIVEVVGLNVKQEELKEGNEYICDIRTWRNQWSSERGYMEQWSDLTIKCLYDPNKQVKIGDILDYEGEKAKVVNLRQIPSVKAEKLKCVTIKEMILEDDNKLNSVLAAQVNEVTKDSKIKRNNTEKFIKTHYIRHIKLIFAGMVTLFIGVFFPPLLLISIILLLSGIICMIKNWKKINNEYKVRKNK